MQIIWVGIAVEITEFAGDAWWHSIHGMDTSQGSKNPYFKVDEWSFLLTIDIRNCVFYYSWLEIIIQ